MATKELVEAIDKVADGFRSGDMALDADNFAAMSLFFQRFDSAEASEAEKRQYSDKLSELISASESVRGLEDMCPTGTDFAAWYSIVKSLNREAIKVRSNLES